MTERSPTTQLLKTPGQTPGLKLDKYSLNLTKLNDLHISAKAVPSSSRGNLLKLSNITYGSSEIFPTINSARTTLTLKKRSTEQNSSRAFQANDSFLSSSQIITSPTSVQQTQPLATRLVKTNAVLGFSKTKQQWTRNNEGPIVNFASPKNYILNKDQDIFGTKLFSGKLKEIMQTEEKKNSFSPSPKKCKLQEPGIMTDRSHERRTSNAFGLKNLQKASNNNEYQLDFSHLSYPAKQLIAYGQLYLGDSTAEHQSPYLLDKRKVTGKNSKPMLSSPVIIKTNNGPVKMKKHQL